MKNRIQFNKTPERAELVKRMASANRAEALEAQQAFADYIRPAVQVVLNQSAEAPKIYTDIEFSKNDRPTIPLDIYLGTRAGNITVWAQQIAGGLATNLVQGLNEYTFTTYRLDSAVSFYDEYIRNANLNVLAAGIDRMINEIVVKQEKNAWSPVLGAVASAATNSARDHVIDSTTSDIFQMDDLNRLMVLIDRLYVSYAGGTPVGGTPTSLTDLFMSPEIMAQIRSLAYQPVNTRSGAVTTSGATSIALPDSERMKLWSASSEFFGINLHKMSEFGVGKKYNTLFDTYYQAAGGTALSTTKEVVIGADLSKEVILRPVITDDDYSKGGQVVVLPDDQFSARSEKVGFYARLREGRVIVDDRVLVGLIVT